MLKQFEHQLYEGTLFFYVRSVTLQLKGDPKVQSGNQSIPFCYFQEAFDPQILIKPFLTVFECLFSFFLQIKPRQE